jgi:hypothetical protein
MILNFEQEQEQKQEHYEYVLLIMNCEKYHWKAQYQKESWLSNLPTFLTYFHVQGNPNLSSEYELNPKQNLLCVNVNDDYNSLPKKVIAAYQAIIVLYPNIKYIFKTDDDQMLSNPKFFQIITDLIKIKKPKTHYGGQKIVIETPYLSQYNKIHPELPNNLILNKTEYCSGRFYFLSKAAIQNLITKRKDIEKEYLEDYAIGLNLSLIYKQNLLRIDTDKFFKDF